MFYKQQKLQKKVITIAIESKHIIMLQTVVECN